MSRYGLLKLPADLVGVGLKNFSFRKEHVESNRLWSIGDTSYYIHEEKEGMNSIVHNRRGKESVDFQILRLNDEQLKKIYYHFLEKKIPIQLKFGFDSDSMGFEVDEMNRLTEFMGFKELEDTDIQKLKEDFEYVVEEEGYSPEQFHFYYPTPYGKLDFTFYTTNFIYVRDRVFPKNEELEKAIPEIITSFLLEIAVVLGFVLEGTSLNRVKLPQHEMVTHPLTNMKKVLELLYEAAGSDVQQTLGIDNEEWDLIQRKLLKDAAKVEGAEMYEFRAKQLVKDIQASEK